MKMMSLADEYGVIIPEMIVGSEGGSSRISARLMKLIGLRDCWRKRRFLA